MTLDKLPIGSGGFITRVNGAGALRLRLLDMGLIPGTAVTVRKMAPLGDPIEIRVRGYELTLRKEDAALIELKGDGENDFCPRRQSEQRKDDAVQCPYRLQPARRQFPRRNRGAKGRRNQKFEK